MVGSLATVYIQLPISTHTLVYEGPARIEVPRAEVWDLAVQTLDLQPVSFLLGKSLPLILETVLRREKSKLS